MASRGGAGSRARSKDRRKKERKARKESMNAQYRQWAAEGVNSRSKRYVRKGVRRLRNRAEPVIDPQTLPHQVHTKLMDLAGHREQFSGRNGALISDYIRSNWDSIEQAWKAHRIRPIRSNLPESYRPENFKRGV